MPSLAPRSCSAPGCGQLAASGGSRCANHKRERQREQDDQRASTSSRGYDVAHKKLRVLCFERDHWTCVDCGWEPTITLEFRELGLDPPASPIILEELRVRFTRGETHLHADHQIPIENRPDLRLDLDNLQTRCNRCHSAKTIRETKGDATLLPAWLRSKT